MATRSRGQIIKRGGSYTVRVFMGSNADGKKIYRNKSAPTKKGAEKLLTSMLTEADNGTAPTAGKLTVAAFLDSWKDSLVGVRQRTAHDYEAAVRLYLRPELGAIRLADLSPVHLRDLYARLVKDRVTKDGKKKEGLSPRSVRKVHTVLHTALERAVRDGLVARNVAKVVAKDALPRKAHREHTVFDQQGARSFLAAIEGHRHQALYALLLDSGMRPEEAVALRWSDFDGASVRVTRAYVLRPKPHYEEPKTAGSRRSIPLTPAVAALIEKHRRHQAEERLKAGPAWQDSGLMFAGPTGGPVRQDTLRKPFRTVLKRAKLPTTMRVYDLRHSCATLLLLAGVSPKVVAERLGHASVVLTLNTYSHVLGGMQEQAVAKLGAALFG